MKAIESEREELGDVGLLGDGGKREEAADRRRLLRRILGFHCSELPDALISRTEELIRVPITSEG